jgi:hypothetical protein
MVFTVQKSSIRKTAEQNSPFWGWIQKIYPSGKKFQNRLKKSGWKYFPPAFLQYICFQPKYVFSSLLLEVCLSLRMAFSLICRTRSRVKPKRSPISSRVIS